MFQSTRPVGGVTSLCFYDMCFSALIEEKCESLGLHMQKCSFLLNLQATERILFHRMFFLRISLKMGSFAKKIIFDNIRCTLMNSYERKLCMIVYFLDNKCSYSIHRNIEVKVDLRNRIHISLFFILGELHLLS